MKALISAATALATLSCSVAASAETRLKFDPVPSNGAVIRYAQGMATVDLRQEHGAVQVTPLGLDHGRLTFGVAVMNTGTQADNFGVEDVAASLNGESVPVLTHDQLDKMAKSRAVWGSVAVALLAGAAAGAAASQKDKYSATTYTPHGTYRTIIHTPSSAGQVEAAAIAAGGAYSIASIQSQLDQTRAALANEIVQTTTIDPSDSYGGRVVFEKPKKNAHLPEDVHITIAFNGEEYPFEFHVTKAD